jgi:hypothetical protein
MTERGSARREIRRVHPPRRRRILRSGGALGLSLVFGFGLTSCANSAALGLVRQACHHVQISLALFRTAEDEPDTSLAAADRARAATELQTAAPLAAEAAGEAPQWQALMATLAENSRLPESDLVGALKQQCALAQTGGTTVPAQPDTSLPAPPG